MMSQNGAKTVVLQAIRDLDCQTECQILCKRVAPPHVTRKAAFSRPMSFNVRLVSDTLYVWGAKLRKFAVTHAMDAFSLYQVAVAKEEATAETTVALLRDHWFRAFGPPQVLMSDQGPEYQGNLEGLLQGFGRAPNSCGGSDLCPQQPSQSRRILSDSTDLWQGGQRPGQPDANDCRADAISGTASPDDG